VLKEPKKFGDKRVKGKHVACWRASRKEEREEGKLKDNERK
jgi:hypothetical protein